MKKKLDKLSQLEFKEQTKKPKFFKLIILNDGLYQLIPVTKQMLEGVELVGDVDCFDLCEILRLKLTGYVDKLNLHIMNDGSGSMIGCMCR